MFHPGTSIPGPQGSPAGPSPAPAVHGRLLWPKARRRRLGDRRRGRQAAGFRPILLPARSRRQVHTGNADPAFSSAAFCRGEGVVSRVGGYTGRTQGRTRLQLRRQSVLGSRSFGTSRTDVPLQCLSIFHLYVLASAPVSGRKARHLTGGAVALFRMSSPSATLSRILESAHGENYPCDSCGFLHVCNFAVVKNSSG